MWFGGLACLYVLYLWSALPGSQSGLAIQDRLPMVFGPTTVALSLLISPAVFAAALERFHPFSREARARNSAHWGTLALFALTAYLLSELGPRIAVSVMAIEQIGTPEDVPMVQEDALAVTRLLLPLVMGGFTLFCGVAGAVVGHATMGWRPKHRNTTRWLACLAMVVFFLLPLLIATSLIRLGLVPAYWIVAGPLAIPAILVGTLMWRLRASLGLSLAPNKKRDIIDSETLDNIVTAVIQADEHPERLENLETTGLELEMVHLAAGVRREVAAGAKISETRVDEIVHAMLEVSAARTPTAVPARTVLDAGRPEVFVTSWGCLTAGLAIASPLGGVPPSLLSALGVGLLGAVAVMLVAHRSPSLSDTVPI